jgi:Ca2+-binding RTX toxin-like protein
MAIINGTAASETLPGTAAADTITGAGGNDTALMGSGNDVFVWNFDDGNDIVEGGAGTDTLRFNATNVNELLTVGAIGGDAGIGRNIGGSFVTLDDVERIELQALGDADIIRINDLSTTDVKQVAIDLSNGTPGVGDGAIDDIRALASKANNTINLIQVAGIISVTGLPAQITLAAAEATDIFEIRSQAGNDKISAAALPAALLLTLNGEEGNDSITGSAGNDTLIGGDGNDSIIGGGGNDTLTGGDGNDTVAGGGGNDFASLGAGNDLFVWNPGDGDDKVEGGDGIDTLRFVDSAVDQEINITTNGGGRTNVVADVGGVFADLNDVERIELRLLGGEDSVMVNSLIGTEVTAVVVDLAGTSGGAAGDKRFDRVGVEGNGDDNSIKVASVGTQVIVSGLSAQVSVVHADKTDILNIFGNSGNDTIDGSKLAAGKLALQLFGSIGADTLIGGAGGNDYVVGGDGNDLALLGAGNDFFDWNLGDDNDTVEGQAGIDTARVNGDASADVFSLSANGARAALTDNVGNATMDMNDVETVWIRARSGADAITVNNLSGTDVKQVSIDLDAGDLAFDTVTVNGTNGNDKVNISSAILITGLPYQVGISGAEADKDSITLNGLGGNDTLDGSKLLAGATPVALDGGAGNDTVIGGVNADVLFGGADNDVLKGAAGADALGAGDGNDVLDGGTDADILSGNNGNDTVTGGAGNDIALLGAGNDLFIWISGDGSDVIQGGTEFDTLRLVGSKASDTIGISANGTLTEIAAPGGADLDAGVERIDIRALDGADTVVVGDLTGSNTTEVAIDLAATLGGKAADTKIDTVTVTAAAGPDVVTVASSKDGKIAVDGLAVDVSIVHAGKTDQLVINALGGADIIDATALAAGKIALTMDGGVGADTLVGSAGNDTVIGGDGNDTVSGGAGNDIFIWNPGADKDTIEGQAGFDTLRVNGASTSENTNISANGGHVLFSQIVANVVQDLNDVERIEFHALDGLDTITINDLSGTDVKLVAIDFAAGGVGAGFGDTVITNGSAGNDVIKMALVGGALSITGLSAQVTVAHELDDVRLEVNALGGNDSVNGSALKLNSVQQLDVDGGAGNDTITGGLGNDNLSGGDDNDKILGGGGDDDLDGDNGKDLLDGGAGNDGLTGGTGNDVLTGGIGDDYVTGGQGDDTITGGTGRDSFQYTNLLDGHDVLIGFDGNPAGGQDVLDLEQLFDGLGVLTADRAGRVSILDKGASVDVLVDTDGNLLNGFELTVATLKTADAITVGQDILVGTL